MRWRRFKRGRLILDSRVRRALELAMKLSGTPALASAAHLRA
jgi:hypothetical protein